MDDQLQRVFGPIAPAQCGGVIYSVTLANGYPVTSPSGFASEAGPTAELPNPQPLYPIATTP